MKQEQYNPRNDPFYINQKLDEYEWELVESSENDPNPPKALERKENRKHTS